MSARFESYKATDLTSTTERKYKNKFHRFLVQFFCKHDDKLISEKEVFPRIKLKMPGARFFSYDYVCNKCSRTKTTGSDAML